MVTVGRVAIVAAVICLSFFDCVLGFAQLLVVCGRKMR